MVVMFAPNEHPEETSATCDWGYCDNETRFWRWSYPDRRWLPVCAEHKEVPDSQRLAEALKHLEALEQAFINRCGNCRYCGTDLEWGPSHKEGEPCLAASNFLKAQKQATDA